MPPFLTDNSIRQFGGMLWTWATLFLPRFVAALAILIAGLFIAGWVARTTQRFASRARELDPALKPIIVAVVRYTLAGLTFLAAIEQLGFQATSVIAVLGAAGLAIGLALQGTLSNIAAGMMLLWLRPFQIGDYIEVASQGGAVEEIGLFASKLRTYDGLFLFLPNSSIWNSPLKNHTRNNGRLISIDLYFPAKVKIELVKAVLLSRLDAMPHVLRDRPTHVFLGSLTTAGAVISTSFWCEPQNAGDVEREAMEMLREACMERVEDERPTQIIRTMPADADPSRFMESRKPLPLWKI